MRPPSGFAPPTPSPCPWVRAWIGKCGEVDRTKCKHSPHVWPYDKPGDPSAAFPKCSCGCGKIAMGECSSAGSFVCGAPLAQGHRHGSH